VTSAVPAHKKPVELCSFKALKKLVFSRQAEGSYFTLVKELEPGCSMLNMLISGDKRGMLAKEPCE